MKVLFILIILLNISTVGYAKEELKLNTCEDFLLEAHQFYLDMVFVYCLDDCLTQARLDPKKLICIPNDVGSFKDFCELNAWGYKVLQLKRYADCMEKSDNSIKLPVEENKQKI